MKNWLNYLLIILTVGLQIGLLPNFRIYGALPNLILIFLLSLLILGRDKAAIWWVIFGGLLLDLFSPFFFGYYCLQLLAVFALYRFAIRPVLHEPTYPLVFALFVVFSLFTACFDSLATRQNPLPGLLALTLYQSILGFIIFYALSKLFRNRHYIKA